MVQVTVSGHTNLGKNILEAIEKKKSRVLKKRAKDIAKSLIENTPVQPTARFSIGAYANSFSFKINNTSSRGRRLKGSTSIGDAKSRIASGDVYDPQAGFQKLLNDVNSADYSDVKSMTFRNDSDHAKAVEDGDGWRSRGGYKVFTNTKAKFS